MPNGPTTRTRKLPASPAVSTSALSAPGFYREDPKVVKIPSGTQVTVSEGHPWPPRKGETDDRGGAFRTSKSYVVEPWFRNYNLAKTDSQRNTFTYSGAVYAGYPGSLSFPFPASCESSDSVLEKLGATAIARCSPTNSPANAAQFLGELYKDGLPKWGAHLWENRARIVRDVRDLARIDKSTLKDGSGDYLNAQFGWRPLVSDVSSFANALVKADAVLTQFERDAGKRVRRRYYFPSDAKSFADYEYGTYGQNHAGGPSTTFYALPSVGRFVVSHSEVRKRWFSGCFTYALPDGYDSRLALRRYSEKADYLLGLNLTPETLWNIAPWSWAVDWFTNVGNVLTNISNFASHGLVMPYGYMMETSVSTTTYTLSDPGLIGLEGKKLPPLTLITEVKKRIPANPFGFGLTWNGLSSFQLSILAALGINKGSRR